MCENGISVTGIVSTFKNLYQSEGIDAQLSPFYVGMALRGKVEREGWGGRGGTDRRDKANNNQPAIIRASKQNGES